ncbi:MAG: hypothetical protein JOZ69_00165 [Myxococcales bacterium]|nr:hypothetical protein [Myxococcales bacterium]
MSSIIVTSSALGGCSGTGGGEFAGGSGSNEGGGAGASSGGGGAGASSGGGGMASSDAGGSTATNAGDGAATDRSDATAGSSGGAGSSSDAASDARRTGTPDASGAPSSGDGAAGAPCTVGDWPTADPSAPGPFATTTENNVGPPVGAGADGGPPVPFTLYRPTNLGQTSLCHPVITWGNGTGTSPSIYRNLLVQLASHGFVVIASNSPNVAQQDGAGDPLPMIAGITWVYAQNDDPTSALYQKIDTTRAGATGHSQGGFATTQAAGMDARIVALAPIAGATATARTTLHGPALLLCGGMDTTVPCSTVMTAFNAINNQPVMLADQLAATHGGWIGSRNDPYVLAVTAWMRIHLMNDTALKPMFYGPSCTLCTDTAVWQVTQKML